MENLKAALRFGGILTKEEIEVIIEKFSERILEPGTEFVAKGRVANEIAFIDSGIIRSYLVNENGEEATKYFFRENQFMADIESYYSRKPSTDPMQAVTSTRILVVKREDWNKLVEEIPKLFLLMKSIAEATLLNKLKDNDFLNFGTATEKYKEFVKRYPSLALQVPQQYIASYLRITPQSLSRIRKGLIQ